MVRAIALLFVATLPSLAADRPVWQLWPGAPPNETRTRKPEIDVSKPGEGLVAGRPLIRLTNVFDPTLEIFQPPADKATGASVVICPGGGHHVLAYDLEGTEIAEWLNGIGVTGIVLKYRVPTRDNSEEKRWEGAVEDAQRAVSVIRSRAGELGLDPARIGICGFSAGGQTAALTALFGNSRVYTPTDDADKVPCRPDFAILAYTAYLANKAGDKLRDEVKVTPEAPPMFIVQAWDDRVTVQSSLLLASALHAAKVPTELHVFPKGGHGYGLRQTDLRITRWPDLCAEWMRESGLLNKK